MGLILILALIPAAASMLQSASADQEITYFLHSEVPAGNVDTVVGPTRGETRSFMDAQEPPSLAPKAVRASGLASGELRKDRLSAHWAGNATGFVHDVRAELWFASERPTNVRVTLFGDGAVSTASPLGSANAQVNFTRGRLITFDLGAASGNVHGELVLQVTVETLEGGVTVLYDDAAFASKLTFTVGPFVPDPPLTRTPAPGWGAVTLVNATSAALETSLAIDPQNPDRLLVCSPSGLGNTRQGQSFFHTSDDGGATWRFLRVETGSTDPRRFTFEGGDCDVAFDTRGTMYSADTWLGSLSIGASIDGGEHWTGTPLGAAAPVVDRPWLVGGPPGVVHATWQDLQFAMPSAIWYARSTDFGLTFSVPASVATATADGAFTWTGNFVVSPDQVHLYSVYTRRASANRGVDANGPETVWVSASHDRGATWTSHLVASMPNPASFLYPSIGMDAGGALHVVFSSKTTSDRPIWYARSIDGAATWSAPVKVLSNVSGWSPWVAGGAPGEAVIQWYGTNTLDASTTTNQDWYFFAARAHNGTITSAGPTTTTPVFRGIQSAIPEFNQVRLDSMGKMHLGASAFLRTDTGTGWALWHQREV